MSDDGGRLIRQDLEELLIEMYIKNFPFLVNGSSTGRNSGGPYNSITVLGAAGAASAKPSTAKTGRARRSGTAASVTSSIPPRWGVVKSGPFYRNGWKAHLVDDSRPVTGSLCGMARTFRVWPNVPTGRMCKRCVRIYENLVLEGHYAR